MMKHVLCGALAFSCMSVWSSESNRFKRMRNQQYHQALRQQEIENRNFYDHKMSQEDIVILQQSLVHEISDVVILEDYSSDPQSTSACKVRFVHGILPSRWSFYLQEGFLDVRVHSDKNKCYYVAGGVDLFQKLRKKIYGSPLELKSKRVKRCY